MRWKCRCNRLRQKAIVFSMGSNRKCSRPIAMIHNNECALFLPRAANNATTIHGPMKMSPRETDLPYSRHKRTTHFENHSPNKQRTSYKWKFNTDKIICAFLSPPPPPSSSSKLTRFCLPWTGLLYAYSLQLHWIWALQFFIRFIKNVWFFILHYFLFAQIKFVFWFLFVSKSFL